MSGVAAAFAAQRELRRRHAVTLVSPSPHLLLKQSLVRAAFGVARPPKPIDLDKALSARGIMFRKATVQSIDPKNNVVLTSEKEIEYDYLFVGLGSKPDYDTVKGIANALPVGTGEQADNIAKAIKEFSGSSVASVNCAGSLWEGPALETLFHAHQYFSEMGKKVELKYVTSNNRPVQELGPQASAAICAELEKRNITLFTKVRTKEITANSIRTSSGEIKSDLTFAFPPQRATIEKTGLKVNNGFIKVDSFMRCIGTPNVFAAGDCVEECTPKTGFTAFSTGSLAGCNIARKILGKRQLKRREKSVYVIELGESEGLLLDSQRTMKTWKTLIHKGTAPYLKKLSFEKSFIEANGTLHYIMGEKVVP